LGERYQRNDDDGPLYPQRRSDVVALMRP